MLPLAGLGLLAAVVLVLALATAPYTLLIADFLAVAVRGEWSVCDVAVNSADVIIAGIALAVGLQRGWRRRWAADGVPHLTLWIASGLFLVWVHFSGTRVAANGIDPAWLGLQAYAAFLVLAAVTRGRRERRQPQGIPYLRLWLVYGTLASAAYLHAPADQAYFTSPLAVAYQLYRYCWKPTLGYVLLSLVLGDRAKLRTLLLFIVLAADIGAAQAVYQGYSGLEVTGPFLTKNQLGGNLIIPFVLSLSALLSPVSAWQQAFHFGSALLLTRALTMAASRGAFIAALVAASLLLCWFLGSADGRRRACRLIAFGLLASAFVLTVKPNALHGPAARELLAIGHGAGTENLRWRLEERWPYFWKLTWERPWFGRGTEVDPSLGATGSTPHNGYLALAVAQGVPAALVFIALAFLGFAGALQASFRGEDRWHRVMAITAAASLLGLLTHDLIDATFLLDFSGKLFWLFLALALVLRHRPRAFPAPAASATRLAAVAASEPRSLSPAGVRI